MLVGLQGPALHVRAEEGLAIKLDYHLPCLTPKHNSSIKCIN